MSLLLDNEFKPLPPDKCVDTEAFLEAVSHLPSFFDCLGSSVFAIIKADITGNITKIKTAYLKDPQKFVTLQDLLISEREAQADKWPLVGATLALMWLKRGLRFIQILLQSLADGERDANNPNSIRVNVVKAYEQALKRYHGWLTQKLFSMALLAAPCRSNFLKALSKGEDVGEEDCLAKVRQFLENFTPTVDAIYEMYTKLNAELSYTV
uniref:Glycolipid transfer protein n=1 Tax=Tetraodon nigroviridis TaxID=99883 RepID=H3CUI6_TETNG